MTTYTSEQAAEEIKAMYAGTVIYPDLMACLHAGRVDELIIRLGAENDALESMIKMDQEGVDDLGGNEDTERSDQTVLRQRRGLEARIATLKS